MSAQIPDRKHSSFDQVQDGSESEPAFEELLTYLKDYRGCDLTGYKRTSLMRRFQYRMQNIHVNTYQDYLQYLQCYPREYQALLNDVLINVSGFFRDRPAWDYLAAEIIPQMLAAKQPDEPIRVWSAGCANGQEIYSLLILLAEALGLDACLQQVRGFATDIDDAAVRRTRQATYSPKEVSDIPPHLLEKYFEQTEQGYVFHPQLRRTVIVSHHDLTRHAPISKVDLLICRNVLIYFIPETQDAILARLHFALKSTGFLFLGQAETLVTHRSIFKPVNWNQKIYAKGLGLAIKDYLAISAKSSGPSPSQSLPAQNYFWEAAFEVSSVAHLAIDTAGRLLNANEKARSLFGLTFEDWKRPIQALKLARLISPNTLAKALYSRQELTVLKKVAWTTEQGIQYFDIDMARVLNAENQVLGVTLTFLASNPYPQLSQELASTRAELAQVSQMLASTQSELNLTYQELESAWQKLEGLQQAISDTVSDL